MKIQKDSIQNILWEVTNRRMLARTMSRIMSVVFWVSLFSRILEGVKDVRIEKGKRASSVTNKRMNPKNLRDVRERWLTFAEIRLNENVSKITIERCLITSFLLSECESVSIFTTSVEVFPRNLTGGFPYINALLFNLQMTLNSFFILKMSTLEDAINFC